MVKLVERKKSKPWTIDPAGNIDTRERPSVWRTAKWGQILSFASGGLCFFLAFQSTYSPSRDLINVGAMLMVLGVALRVIDVWKSKT